MASNKQRQKAAYRQTCQKLTGEHRDVMKAMEAYIKNSELKKEEVFSICRKLAEKLYRAQRQGQTLIFTSQTREKELTEKAHMILL